MRISCWEGCGMSSAALEKQCRGEAWDQATEGVRWEKQERRQSDMGGGKCRWGYKRGRLWAAGSMLRSMAAG
jgi:hypothetical protein